MKARITDKNKEQTKASKVANSLVGSIMSKEEIEAAKTEPITEDGGLGDLGRRLQAKIDSGEINNMTNKELMDSYMEIIELLGNDKLSKITKMSLIKKNRGQLVDLCAYAASTAIKHSKN